MIRDYPIFGVGLGQYFVELPKYIKGAGFRDYQPVHNAFLLILAETGIGGFILFFLLFLKFSIFNFQFPNKFQISNFKFQIIFAVLLLSFFDHYFYTTQQGNLMVGLILGIANLKLKSQNAK